MLTRRVLNLLNFMQEVTLFPVSTFSQIEEIARLPLGLTRLSRVVSCRRNTLVLRMKVVAVVPILASPVQPVLANRGLSRVQKCTFVTQLDHIDASKFPGE